jgi:hypothetical protein
MSIAVYLRVSTGQQSVDQQHDLVAVAGVVPDRYSLTLLPGVPVVIDRAGPSAWAGSGRMTTWSSSP